MTSKQFKVFTTAVACSVMIAVFCLTAAVAGPYQPCSVPPVVGMATKPNVVIVMVILQRVGIIWTIVAIITYIVNIDV